MAFALLIFKTLSWPFRVHAGGAALHGAADNALGSLRFERGMKQAPHGCRLGVLFYMVLYLSMMALGSLPVWRQEALLFARLVNAWHT